MPAAYPSDHASSSSASGFPSSSTAASTNSGDLLDGRNPETPIPPPRSSSLTHATLITNRPEVPKANPQQPPAVGHDPNDIEMDAVTPSGHRRRRSSLINPANSSNNRNPAPNGDGEDKIVEESSDDDSPRNGGGDDDGLSDEDLHDDEEAGLTGKDKRRKRRKKRKNQLLDQRVVSDDISPEEKKEADRNVLKNLIINIVLIGLWYLFSLLISLYNKWMFSPDKLNFRFPMFTTAMHFLVQFSLASLVLWGFPSLRPNNGHKSDLGQSRHEAEPERPLMTKLFYITRIGPCGVATGLDIGLGNTSLQFITLTFYTMCKSSSLAFVLIFAFLFRLESVTWKLVGIIATMTLGVVMMVAGEVEFKLGGFILVIAAAFFSGFRWALTQILLLRNPATSNPFSSIFFLAPVMFITLISIAIPVEGAGALIEGLKGVAHEKGALVAPLIILFPGMIAFLMTVSEFALLKRTSVVTLSIAGIFKEAVTISAAAVVFGDTMTAINVVGLVITIAAIAAYNWIKISKMRNEAQTDVHRGHLVDEDDDGFPSSSGSGSNSDRDDDQWEDAGLLRRSGESDRGLLAGDQGPGPELSTATGMLPASREERTD